MLYLIMIPIAITAGSILLAFVSDTFAYEMSRVIEAAFDAMEYRLASRAERRDILRQTGRRIGDIAYAPQAEPSL